MFTLVPNPTFTVEVPVFVPVEGGHETQTVKATYKVIPTDEFSELDLTTTKGSRKFLKRAVGKLSDIVDDEGNPLPWNDALRDKLFSLPYVANALARGYFEAIYKSVDG